MSTQLLDRPKICDLPNIRDYYRSSRKQDVFILFTDYTIGVIHYQGIILPSIMEFKTLWSIITEIQWCYDEHSPDEPISTSTLIAILYRHFDLIPCSFHQSYYDCYMSLYETEALMWQDEEHVEYPLSEAIKQKIRYISSSIYQHKFPNGDG